jgi:hypothetical protein
MKTYLIIIFITTLSLKESYAQMPVREINPNLLKQNWEAYWIAPPKVSLKEYGVFHFRKTLTLAEKPSQFIIHVSADNRYRLFVNGKSVCVGSARGDILHWNFETLDIANELVVGKNVVSALVWNMGEYLPWAQMTKKTAFILQGNTQKEKIINTNDSWKVTQNEAYNPLYDLAKLQTFIVVGAGDEVNGEKYTWGWQDVSFNDENWTKPRQLEIGTPKGVGTGADWHLVPRTIPLMEEKQQRISKIVRNEGAVIGDGFLKGRAVTIPPNTKATLLLDQTFLTNAYPQLLVSGGKSASVQFTYAEALFDKKNSKGNRNEINEKSIRGAYDIFYLDGATNRLYSTLWFRTYRYIEMKIETKGNPLTINDLYGIFTGYPFEEKASFETNDNSLKDIWNVGWRTARLCALETYVDCPYYEQLQYIGDTRIQALISLYVTGDDRLMRKAIVDFDNSRIPEGLTQSRYPSAVQQIIPTFSLFWTNMVYDYFMHRKDDEFVKAQLQGIENVLGWYEKHLDNEKNMLGGMEWWNFVDWARAWPWLTEKNIGGEPQGSHDGYSSIITFQYAYSLNLAAQIFDYYGKTVQASHYRQLAQKISKSTFDLCVDKSKGIIGDTPDKQQFSQHAIIMGILSEGIPANEHKAFMTTVLQDKNLIQGTFYFRFYLTQALKKAGMSELYYSNLTPWRDMLQMGLTTFAENPEPTRSDCHAWSSSPNYDFLATICGIMPASAGFESVLIQPALGELQNVEAKMPHPKGEIILKLTRKGEGVEGEIYLPTPLTGKFVWKEQEMSLKSGKNMVKW